MSNLYAYASPDTQAAYADACREATARHNIWRHLIRRRAILRATAPGRRAEVYTNALALIHAALAAYRKAAARVLEVEHQLDAEHRRAVRNMAQALAA